MRVAIALAVLAVGGWLYARGGQHAAHAVWDGERFVCPERTDMWADENEALQGKDDYVYCIERAH